MSEYHKIDSVFKRDPATKHKSFIMGDWSQDAFGYLAKNEWEFTEKVDGTNIRVTVGTHPCQNLGYAGRTDAASIPSTLLLALNLQFGPFLDLLCEAFPDGAVLYGEGYGARIQKNGGNYRPDQGFVLFDVRVGDLWLERANVENVAQRFNLDIVPVIGRGTLHDMVAIVQAGISSTWGAFEAEGIVARPVVGMRDRTGRRIITKVKCRDFAASADKAA